MKNFVLAALTASALTVTSFAAFADSDGIIIRQVGSFQSAKVNQSGFKDYASLNQNGGNEYAVLNQTGSNNTLSVSEGKYGVLEPSTANSSVGATQNGSDNYGSIYTIGNTNSAKLNQNGISDTASINQNTNYSTVSISQNGSKNYAAASQK